MKKLALTLAVFLFVSAESFAISKGEVSFAAPDGFSLKGTFYSAGKAGPGLLLLHQCNADRQVYDQLGTMLSTAGYNVLAFDFRGFGASKGEKMMEKMPGDVDAAFTFLSKQDFVNTNALGIVAGSCGVNQAIHAAQRHPTVRTMVLLSGGTDADGEAFIKNSPKMTIFGVASEEDKGPAESIKKIVGLSTNQSSELQMLKDAGHAAFMFEKEPDLQADIVIWFRSNLAVGGYGLPPTIK
jgi:pimeloyl-ACP methyl ester carboxylesterase